MTIANLNRRGRFLIRLAQVAWWILFTLSLLGFILAVPAYSAKLHEVCIREPCLSMQLNWGRAIILELWGLSFSFYAWFILVIQALVYLVNLGIGVFIFWRKSSDYVAILVSAMLITSLQADLYRALLGAHSALALPAALFGLINSILLIVFFYVFPTGSFQPRWTAALAGVWIIAVLANAAFPVLSFTSQARPEFYFLVFLATLIGSSLFVLYFRYRRVFNPLQRIQTKWVVFGGIVTWGGELLFEIIQAALPVFEHNALLIVGWNVLTITWSIIFPVSILLAVLSSALLDIDILIRRTLAYSLLTITLLVVYVGVVLFLQMIFELLTGQRSPYIAIISTLVIAALFSPLRQRLQSEIDRLFFRQRYNLEYALQEFSTSIKTGVDLEDISGELLSVVRDTLKPEYYSLWICSVNPNKSINDEDQIT